MRAALHLLQPAPDVVRILELAQRDGQVLNAALHAGDVTREQAHHGVGRDLHGRRDAVGSAEIVLHVFDLAVELAQLLVEDAVVARQPRFAEAGDRMPVDLFDLKLKLQQLQQVALRIGVVDPLHQRGLAFLVVRIGGAIGMQRAGQLAVDLADRLARFGLLRFGARLRGCLLRRLPALRALRLACRVRGHVALELRVELGLEPLRQFVG
jgi:hypothetical protein